MYAVEQLKTHKYSLVRRGLPFQNIERLNYPSQQGVATEVH